MAELTAKRKEMDFPVPVQARIGTYYFLACSLWLLHSVPVEAQRSVSNTPLPTAPEVKVLSLNLEIPHGGLYLESSARCGYSSVQLAVPQSTFSHSITEETTQPGYLNRRIILGPPHERQAPGTNTRMPEIFNPLSAPQLATDISTKYLADPSVVTNLSVLVSPEGALLDLSNLSLNRLSVSSNTGTVHLLYNAPNTRQMQDMTIHVARALLVIKNLEFAHAKEVHVRNDMGDTRIWLGNGLHPGSAVTVKCGTGNLLIYVDRAHPVEVHLKETFLSGSSIKDTFQEVSTGVYRNAACRYHTGTTPISRLYCQMDMGKVTIIEVDSQ